MPDQELRNTVEGLLTKLRSRAEKVLLETEELRRGASRAEYAAKKALEEVDATEALLREIDSGEPEPAPEPEPEPEPEPGPQPEPGPEEPYGEYSTFAPFDPAPPKEKQKLTTRWLLVEGVSSGGRYNRDEHGFVLDAPFTLRCFVASDGGRTGGGQQYTDIHKPRVRYIIDGKPTRWYEYPDYDHPLDPKDFAPGAHYIRIESDTPGVNWISEVTAFTVPGKTGPQKLYAGPHKYDVISGHDMAYSTSTSAGSGVVEINWNGKYPVPVPLKIRPATPYHEAKPISELWVQAILPYKGAGISAPYLIPGGDGFIAAHPQHYYTGNIWGRRLPMRPGPRGTAYAPAFPVDGHISEAGNFYAISTSGTIMRYRLDGTAQLLVGWTNDYGTFSPKGGTSWPNPYARFHGRFMNNTKPGWHEPWGFAFRTESLEIMKDPNHPSGRGGFHPHMNIQAVVPDTFHGDVDIVVWDKDREPDQQVPKIYTIARAIGEVWGACYDPKRKRWWVAIRSSIERWAKTPFTPDQGHRIVYWRAEDVDEFIDRVDRAGDIMDVPLPPMHVAYDCPIKLKGDHISNTTSWRWASDWPTGLADRRAVAAQRRAQYWRPGHKSQALFVHPEMIKMASNGKLGISSQYLGMVAMFDPDTESFEEVFTDCVQAMGSESHWLNFSFDDGNSGPKDYVRCFSWKRFAGGPWGCEWGGEAQPLWPEPSGSRVSHQGLGRYFDTPNYPMMVIAKNGAIWMGGGHSGLLRATLPLPTDPRLDYSKIQLGATLYKRGTLPKYEITRPSLEFMYGPVGVSQWGNEPFKWTLPPEFFEPDAQVYLDRILAYHAYCRLGTIYEDKEYEIVGHTIQEKR